MSDDVGRLEQRVRTLEQRVAELRGEPVPGSRADLIRRGFRLTDESRARARQALAASRQRHADTDWPALRERCGLPREGRGSPITDAHRLAKLQTRLTALEQRLNDAAAHD